jgi:8-oxo-dGTP pyrophosphatase MutT (NUDIX family)
MTLALWQHPDLPTLLAADLTKPAEAAWGREFAPELVYGRHAGPARADARGAAVTVVFCWDGNENEWLLPLTVRAADLKRHGGQVSFPGGLIDGEESPRDAAARELAEELGVTPELAWLGNLSPQFVYASNAWVVPCVAATAGVPQWRPSPNEVERVISLRIDDLLNQPPAPPLEIVRGPLRFAAPQLRVEDHSAWGATAVMLGELRGRLRQIERSLE